MQLLKENMLIIGILAFTVGFVEASARECFITYSILGNVLVHSDKYSHVN
jgi:hypothetical protein